MFLKNDVLKEARDVFVFCCYTGLAYVDFKKLCLYSNLVEFEGLI